jgi:hypothetical protein
MRYQKIKNSVQTIHLHVHFPFRQPDTAFPWRSLTGARRYIEIMVIILSIWRFKRLYA